MKKSLKILSMLGAILVSLGGLSSCKNNTKTDEEGNTIVTVSLMNSTNENPGWLAQIDAANKVLESWGEKIRIETEIIMTDSWDTFYSKVASNMIGQVGGTIIRIAESHVPMMIENNQLQDITDVVNELKESGEYNNASFDGVAYSGGKYYGIPTGTQHMLLFYNKDKFDEYNLAHPSEQISYPSGDWENASTFSEIRDMASKLSSGEGASREFGISMGPYLAYAGMYSKNNGGYNIFDDNGELAIKTEAFYDVYEWFDALLKTDKSMPTTSDTSTSSAVDRFLSGNLAMIVDGVWQLHDFTTLTNFDVGVAAIPVGAKGLTSYTTTFVDKWVSLRNSRTAEEDKVVLKALQSAEALTALGEKSVGGFPIRNDCVENYVNTLDNGKLHEYLDTIIDGRETGVQVPYSTYYNSVDQRINQRMSSWITGEMTAREFVDYMDEVMRQGINGEL